MTEFLTAALGVILAMLALGLVRILRGPGEADRMMAAQLIGTGGIAALLLLGAVTGVQIGGISMGPGVSFGAGVSFAGVDLASIAGRDLEVEQNPGGPVIIKGHY